eukprot:290034_1
MDLRFAVDSIQILNADKEESTLSEIEFLLNTKIKTSSYIVSDVDEELLILLKFKDIVDLQTIKIHAVSQDNDNNEISSPKEIDVYALEKLDIDFSDVTSMKPHKSIKCIPAKLNKGQKMIVAKTRKFKKVQSVAIYIKSNQNDTENTFVNSITLKGEINNADYKQSFESKTNDSKIRVIERVASDTNFGEFELILNKKDFQLFQKAQQSEVTFISNYQNIGGCIVFFEVTPNGFSDITKHCTNIWLRLHSLPDKKKFAKVKFQWKCIANDGKISFFDQEEGVLSRLHGYEGIGYSISTKKGIPFSDFQDICLSELRFQCYVTIKDICVEEIKVDTIKHLQFIQIQNKPIITNKLSNFQPCDGDVKICNYASELKTIMREYDIGHYDSTKAIIANKVFHHLLFVHDELQDFEFILNSLQIKCNIKKCAAFQRIYRNRTKIDIKVKEYIQCFDVIHCYYHHSFDIGYRLTTKEKKTTQTFAESKNNEDDKDDEKQAIFGSDHELQNMQQIIVPKKSPVVVNSKRHEKFNQFHFGTAFVYEGKKQNVKPAYNSLKEELIQNKIYPIFIEQFNLELSKATIKFHSISNDSKYKNKLPVDEKCCIPLMLSLMVYCNYDALQREFSKTYRENTHQHECFYYLAKNISTAVNSHGEELIFSNKEKIKSFYHGVNAKLSLPKIIGPYFGIQIFCPLSTSTSRPVAINFANFNGIVIDFGCPNIQIKNRPFKTCYFDVSWLSDFPHEHERLFIQMKSGIYVNNILDVTTTPPINYRIILNALKIIDSIIMPAPKDWHEWKSEKNIERLILAMIKDQISHESKKHKIGSKYSFFTSLAPYAKTTIRSYFENAKLIYLDHGAKRYPFFTEFFVGNDSNECRINELPLLFPFVQGIIIKNVKLDKVFDNVLTLFKGANTYTETILKYIILYPDCKNEQNEIRKTIHTAMIDYGAKFIKIGYCLSEYDNVKAIAISLKSELPLPSVKAISVGDISLAEGAMLLLNLQ